jgi:hypothetical protein
MVIEEYFNFLFNGQILDAVGTSREGFHSIKGRKQATVVMEIDLSKAYDKVSWLLLRLVLHKIGLNLQLVN